MLDQHSFETLTRRIQKGAACIALEIEDLNSEDFDSAAKDAISDILTARFGPAGKTVAPNDLTADAFGRYRIEHDYDAVDGASVLVQAALDSWRGDAEDYIDVPAPGAQKPTADVVVVRDPDASNEITLCGVEANVIDVDLGAMNLADDSEWSEWVLSRKIDYDNAATDEARRIISNVVYTAADCFGQAHPTWTVEWAREYLEGKYASE